jgi:hypothetical protein
VTGTVLHVGIYKTRAGLLQHHYFTKAAEFWLLRRLGRVYSHKISLLERLHGLIDARQVECGRFNVVVLVSIVSTSTPPATYVLLLWRRICPTCSVFPQTLWILPCPQTCSASRVQISLVTEILPAQVRSKNCHPILLPNAIQKLGQCLYFGPSNAILTGRTSHIHRK